MRRARDPHGGLIPIVAMFGWTRRRQAACARREVCPMLDLIFPAITAGFFFLAWVYTLGCDRL